MKKITEFIMLLPVYWLFSGFFIFNGGDKSIVALIIISIVTSISTQGFDTVKQNYQDIFFRFLLLNAILGSVYYLTIGYGSGEVRTYIAMCLYSLFLPRNIIKGVNTNILILLAATISSSLIIYNSLYLDINRGLTGFNPIPYAVALSMLSVISFHAIIFKNSKVSVISFGLLITSIILTETRGAIIPSLLSYILIILYAIQRGKLSIKRTILLASGLFLCFLVTSESILNRIEVSKIEINRIYNSDLNSSIGLRFQFWNAAKDIYKNKPILGSGNAHEEEMKLLYKQGRVSKRVMQYSPTHYHNQFIDKLVKNGIIGFILLMITISLPIVYITRDKEGKVIAYSLTLLIIVSCLTDTPLSQPFSLLIYLVIMYFLLPFKNHHSGDGT